MGRYRCTSSTPPPRSPSPTPNPHLSRHLAEMTMRPEAGTSSRTRPPSPGPSSRKASKDKGKGKARATSPDPTIQRERVRMAAKRGKVKRRSGLKPGLWSFVFVGGLIPSITEPMIRDIFRGCGTIARVQMRMGAGYYASVEFYEQSAPKKAVDQLNGAKLGDLTIVVCYSAADLPEVQKTRIAYEQRQRGTAPRPVPKSTVEVLVDYTKKVTVNRTIVASEMLDLNVSESTRQPEAGPSGEGLTPRVRPPQSKHRLMGISFPKTLI
ncbi:hypothetical protein CERSUDRAFT_111602 [Gelatoporia subvermispora B]|uniref:RRM domain-containing protein n=1 Tax=Ceriporiopsis subvermispora (strain B) TaxID=914234 RepID=M2PW53_CERS8|nr:hypothetical protein CERSUDRAFT_111602 [Gelatoporia subvermispora B]